MNWKVAASILALEVVVGSPAFATDTGSCSEQTWPFLSQEHCTSKASPTRRVRVIPLYSTAPTYVLTAIPKEPKTISETGSVSKRNTNTIAQARLGSTSADVRNPISHGVQNPLATSGKDADEAGSEAGGAFTKIRSVKGGTTVEYKVRRSW